jgi:hypothetical protein
MRCGPDPLPRASHRCVPDHTCDTCDAGSICRRCFDTHSDLLGMMGELRRGAAYAATPAVGALALKTANALGDLLGARLGVHGTSVQSLAGRVQEPPAKPAGVLTVYVDRPVGTPPMSRGWRAVQVLMAVMVSLAILALIGPPGFL